MRIAKARHRVTLGQAVSTFVRQGAARPIVTVERNGFRILALDRRSPKVTAVRVAKLLDQQS